MCIFDGYTLDFSMERVPICASLITLQIISIKIKFLLKIFNVFVQMVSVWTEQAKVLKEEVRTMVTSATEKPSGKLTLIDAIQQLGIAYHFNKEIEEVLEQVYKTCQQDYADDDKNLYIVALQFRLLRQQGYNVLSGN